MKTKICCISDLHGNLPEIPDCDLLLIAGDIVPLWAQNDTNFSNIWMNCSFKTWINKISNRGITIVGIAGNHDFCFEKNCFPKNLAWHYLQDKQYEYNGLKIWGTPWQPYFGGWAFNLYEEQLSNKWDLIPKDTDIIIVHGPPYLHGDNVLNIQDGKKYQEHVGSPSLLRKIQEVKPKLVVCGHVHCSAGIYHIDDTIVVNASYVDEQYKPTSKIFEITL